MLRKSEHRVTIVGTFDNGNSVFRLLCQKIFYCCAISFYYPILCALPLRYQTPPEVGVEFAVSALFFSRFFGGLIILERYFSTSQFWRAISMRCSAMDMLNEFVSPSLTSRVSTRSSNPSHHLSSEGRVVQCPETQSNFINSQPFQTKTAFCHVRFECRGYKNKCHAKLHGIYFYSLRPDQMWGPAATRALPASLVSNFLKLLMNISASFLALSSHSLASA